LNRPPLLTVSFERGRVLPTLPILMINAQSTLVHSLRAALLGGLVLVPLACTTQRGYGVLASFPHKDVLQVTVFLEEAADADTYRRIASRELDRFRGIMDDHPHPVYQFRVEYHEARRPHLGLARITVDLPSTGHPEAHDADKIESWRVYLY